MLWVGGGARSLLLRRPGWLTSAVLPECPLHAQPVQSIAEAPDGDLWLQVGNPSLPEHFLAWQTGLPPAHRQNTTSSTPPAVSPNWPCDGSPCLPMVNCPLIRSPPSSSSPEQYTCRSLRAGQSSHCEPVAFGVVAPRAHRQAPSSSLRPGGHWCQCDLRDHLSTSFDDADGSRCISTPRSIVAR